MDTSPVEHSVGKAHGELDVGTDLRFEQGWWRTERVIWFLLGMLVLAGLSGALGRGPLASNRGSSAGGSIQYQYDRVQRAGTPTTVKLRLFPPQTGGPSLYLGGEVQDSSGLELTPPPDSTVAASGGAWFRFAAAQQPVQIAVSFKPGVLGRCKLRLAVGADAVELPVLVLP